MLNVYSHPDKVQYEDDPALLRFTDDKYGGEVCVFLEYLPKHVQEFFRAAAQNVNVEAQVDVDVEAGKRTVKITFNDEDLRADAISKDV